MEKETLIGVTLVVMLCFSLVVSFVRVEMEILPGIEFPLEGKKISWAKFGNQKLEIGKKDEIDIGVGLGSLIIRSSPDESTWLEIEGSLIEAEEEWRISLGEVRLLLPEEWGGELRVDVGMGEIKILDVELESLNAHLGMGSFDGGLKVRGNVSIDVGMGEVDLRVGVPKGTKVKVIVEASSAVVREAGPSGLREVGRVAGGRLERVIGEGKREITVKVTANQVDLLVEWED